MRQSVVVFVTEILLELATKIEILNYTSITSALYTGEIIRVERIFLVGIYNFMYTTISKLPFLYHNAKTR